MGRGLREASPAPPAPTFHPRTHHSHTWVRNYRTVATRLHPSHHPIPPSFPSLFPL